MPEMSFLMAVVLDAGKNFSKNTLLRSSQLKMDLRAR